MCFDFIYNFCLTLSHSKENWARCDKKYVLTFMEGIRYFSKILMTLEFSRQIFEKYSDSI